MKHPLVSIIVPTRNSADFLPACLESIRKQTYKNIELIVVDRDSTDNTKAIAGIYTTKIFNIQPERSVQRNLGAKHATGEFVVMVDSDMELHKSVIKDCVYAAIDNNAVGVVIPEESFGEGFWAQCKKLERSFYVGVAWMEAARFFTREAYMQVGGYNEDLLSGEDWDLSQRIAKLGPITRVDSYIYHNEGRLSLGKTLKKKYYYAQQFAKYMSANKTTTETESQTGIVARYKLFLSKPDVLLQQPHVGLGMLFMKTCEFGVGAIGLITSKLRPKEESV